MLFHALMSHAVRPHPFAGAAHVLLLRDSPAAALPSQAGEAQRLEAEETVPQIQCCVTKCAGQFLEQACGFL